MGDMVIILEIILSFAKTRHIRVICSVMKTEHQNPEFGHKWGEIKKNLAKKCIGIHNVL
jgi:hypothetical protein